MLVIFTNVKRNIPSFLKCPGSFYKKNKERNLMLVTFINVKRNTPPFIYLFQNALKGLVKAIP